MQDQSNRPISFSSFVMMNKMFSKVVLIHNHMTYNYGEIGRKLCSVQTVNEKVGVIYYLNRKKD